MPLLFNKLSGLVIAFFQGASFNFMAAFTTCSDFGAPQNKVCHCFHCFCIYLPWSNGTGCHQIKSDQSLSCFQLFATPWIAVRQASLSITNSRSSLRLMSIESVMPSSHLILCHPLLLLPPNPPSIRVFSNDSTLRMRWPKYWSFSFSIIPSKEHPGWSPLEWTDWISLQSKGL